GEVDLEAHHRHYTEAELKGFQVISGKPAEVTLELGEGGRIRGTVRREDKLVSGVRIIGMRRGEVLAREAFTDSEGHFELRGLAEGEYSLRAMRAIASQGYRTVRAVELVVKEGEATEVELVEGARWKLGGRVSSGGSPVPGGSIHAEQPESGESAEAEIDASGAYSLELDGSGRYLFTIERSGKGRGGARVEVVLPDGAGELRRDLELPSGEARGMVVDGGTGTALPDVQVWAVAEAAAARSLLSLHGAVRSSATTGADGRFVLADLAPGAFSLRAFAAGYADARVDGVKVDERGPSGEIRIALERGMALEAKIVDADGQPVSGAVAWLRTARGDLAAAEPRTSDDEGLVTLSAPGEGGYRLTVVHASYAPSALPVEVKAGSAGATVALRPGGKLRLRVVDRKGKPVEGAEVEARNDRGENIVEDLVLFQA
ncbi:MAG: MSCRAMM family protein, partial [Thermoanaerobaculia bacterium]